MNVDVVIVSHNTHDDLVACLTSLHQYPPSGLGTVFVVDNASADGSTVTVRQRWPAARVIALDRNIGFGAANNVALRESQADLVLLLNSDTIVRDRALDVLIGRLEETSAVAAGPRLVDRDGRPEVSFGAMLTPGAELKQRLRVRLARRRSGIAARYIERLVADEQWVDWVSGACLLVKRLAAVDAGLFDERYFLYEEDVDFCAALRRNGGRILFTPRATIVHARGRSMAAAGGSGHYDRSHLAFYEKHAPLWAPWLRLWLRVRGRSIR